MGRVRRNAQFESIALGDGDLAQWRQLPTEHRYAAAIEERAEGFIEREISNSRPLPKVLRVFLDHDLDVQIGSFKDVQSELLELLGITTAASEDCCCWQLGHRGTGALRHGGAGALQPAAAACPPRRHADDCGWVVL